MTRNLESPRARRRWTAAGKIAVGLLWAGVQLAGASLWAANKNAGTSGAAFLKIGAGARPAGMGEAFTAIADDVNAVAWNPAGLGRLSKPEFTATHSQWFQGARHEFLATAYPAPWGTVAVAMTSLTVDKIDKRTEDTDAPDGTFDSNDSVYTLSYARPLGKALWTGVNVKYIRQELDSESAAAVSGDVGALWQKPRRPFSAGLAIRHLGPEIKFSDEGDPLPLTATLGLGYRLLGDRLRLGLDLRRPRDNDFQAGGGAEFTQGFSDDVSGSFRAGYNSGGTDPSDGLSGVSVGLGLTWRRLSLDAAWVPYGFLGNTFRYAFLLRF
jgi:hypothetical protein